MLARTSKLRADEILVSGAITHFNAAGSHGRVCHHVAGVALRRATENSLRELARLRRAVSATRQDVAAA